MYKLSFNQFRSNFRKGEPEDHKHAKNVIAEGLDLLGLDVHKEYPLLADMYHPYKHNYDVVAFGKVVVVEVDSELHNKPKKKVNDAIAQARAEESFPYNLQFIRLDKDDINYAYGQNDSDWFVKNLWNKVI